MPGELTWADSAYRGPFVAWLFLPTPKGVQFTQRTGSLFGFGTIQHFFVRHSSAAIRQDEKPRPYLRRPGTCRN